MKKILGIIAIMLCLSMIGCGKEKTDDTGKVAEMDNNTENVNIVEEESDNTALEDSFDNFKETVSNMDVYSDDTKYVFNLEDNTTAIYYHNGTEITGYEIRVKYDSPELAKAAKDEYAEYEEDNIESLTVEGDTLIAKYKKEEYENTSLDDIKLSYSLIQLMQNNQEE